MELKLDPEKWRAIRGMARVLDALGADEGLTRYVGGAVRDELLALPVNDVDLATRLRPEEVIERLEKMLQVGNLYDPQKMADAGLLYYSIGRAAGVPLAMSSTVHAREASHPRPISSVSSSGSLQPAVTAL